MEEPKYIFEQHLFPINILIDRWAPAPQGRALFLSCVSVWAPGLSWVWSKHQNVYKIISSPVCWNPPNLAASKDPMNLNKNLSIFPQTWFQEPTEIALVMIIEFQRDSSGEDKAKKCPSLHFSTQLVKTFVKRQLIPSRRWAAPHGVCPGLTFDILITSWD